MAILPLKTPSELSREELETLATQLQATLFQDESGQWILSKDVEGEVFEQSVRDSLTNLGLNTAEVQFEFDVVAKARISAGSLVEAQNAAQSLSGEAWNSLEVTQVTTDLPPVEPPVVTGPLSLFPPDDPYHMKVDTLPVHPNSTGYINRLGASGTLSPNFGSYEWPENQNPPSYPGIYFYRVKGTQPLVPVQAIPEEIYPPDIPWEIRESDLDPVTGKGRWPLPLDAKVEFAADPNGDWHLLVWDVDNHVLYEMWRARRGMVDGVEGWHCTQATKWDLTKKIPQRPLGKTSADGAGLPFLAGVIRAEEIDAGHIDHAIRITSSASARGYITPATHFCGNSSADPPMGLRLRLKASFDITRYHPKTQIILKAMKEHGLIVADNGRDWGMEASPPSVDYWTEVVADLESIQGNNFEVVTTGDPVQTVEF